MADTVQKKKRLGMSCPAERPTHPIRGARRHELPCRPGTHLPAALIDIPRRAASPHLKARHSPGCKPERLSATSPVRSAPLRTTGFLYRKVVPASAERSGERGKRSWSSPILQPSKCPAARCGGRPCYNMVCFSTAGRRLLDFAGSSYRSLLRLGELTPCGPTHPQRLFF